MKVQETNWKYFNYSIEEDYSKQNKSFCIIKSAMFSSN